MEDKGISKEERNKYYKSLKDKGIITDEVDKRIREEIQNSPQSQIKEVERNITWGSPEWKGFAKAAAKIASEEGYPLPVILGQAAIETGRSPGNAPRNNWFGIKGQGNAGTQNLGTQEASGKLFYNTRSNFAAYQTPEDSVRAYIDVISNLVPNWKDYARTGDNQGLVQAIKNAGYATNPNYVALVTNTPEFRVFAQKL